MTTDDKAQPYIFTDTDEWVTSTFVPSGNDPNLDWPGPIGHFIVAIRPREHLTLIVGEFWTERDAQGRRDDLRCALREAYQHGKANEARLTMQLQHKSPA